MNHTPVFTKKLRFFSSCWQIG